MALSIWLQVALATGALSLLNVQQSAGKALFLSESDKLSIVEVHNQIRKEVAKPAANMQKMSWNQELENIAAWHTRACRWAPNFSASTEARHSFPEGVGENSAFELGTKKRSPVEQAKHFIREWTLEKMDYETHTNRCLLVDTCKHYQQMIQSSINSVGCVVWHCEKFAFFGMTLPNVTWMTCHYGPALTEGEPTYELGEPCSACQPANTSMCDAGLCVNTALTGSQPTPTPVPVNTFTLMPKECEQPATNILRTTCWQEAWRIYNAKLKQWEEGRCPTV